MVTSVLFSFSILSRAEVNGNDTGRHRRLCLNEGGTGWGLRRVEALSARDLRVAVADIVLLTLARVGELWLWMHSF